jgi:hypothetical protein
MALLSVAALKKLIGRMWNMFSMPLLPSSPIAIAIFATDISSAFGERITTAF